MLYTQESLAQSGIYCDFYHFHGLASSRQLMTKATNHHASWATITKQTSLEIIVILGNRA